MNTESKQQQFYDDEYQNALLGDVGLATQTNPNIPLNTLFPHLAASNTQNDLLTANDVKSESSSVQISLGWLHKLVKITHS